MCESCMCKKQNRFAFIYVYVCMCKCVCMYLCMYVEDGIGMLCTKNHRVNYSIHIPRRVIGRGALGR